MYPDRCKSTKRALKTLTGPFLIVLALLHGIPAQAQSAATQVPNNTLQLQDFMKLLLTQLTAQDPLSPQNPQDFLVQIAQMTNLQQTQQISTNTTQMLTTSLASQALTLIGRNVTFAVNSSGSPSTGSVKAVNFSATGTVLDITSNGSIVSNVTLAQIISVQ